MAKETEDMVWARQKLEHAFYDKSNWSDFLRQAGENISGLHEIAALILIAKGIDKKPIEKVIERLKKEGLADGAGIDSARNL